MSENVTIIFYPYIYNNKIDFTSKKTYTHDKKRVDVLSKRNVTNITKGEGLEVRCQASGVEGPKGSIKSNIICK